MEKRYAKAVFRFVRAHWHWIAVGLVLFAAAWPFLMAGDSLLGVDLQGDALATPWIYDFTARELSEGRWVSALTDFDYPNPRGVNPHERSLFATTPPMDAVLMAPSPRTT